MNLIKSISCLGAGLVPLTAAQAETKPNVVIIYIDDMGIGDIGCYGGKFVPTPHIDKLAQDGLLFRQYYSAASVSSASRCGLLTGMFPIRHHINTFLSKRAYNRHCEQRDFLDDGAPSMARAFQQAGYATAHIGKWHLGGGRDVDNAPSINDYGFDEYISTYESPDPDPALTASEWIWCDNDSVKRWKRTEYFVDRSIEFVKRHTDEPFFLNLWPDDMHTPWVPEGKQKKKKEWKSEETFIPVLAEMDKQIGRFINALDELGLSENTIVIFTSDNGPDPSFESARSAYLRGMKNSLYEGGIRMPFIIKYPKKIKAGQVNRHSVLSAVDLYPSLCAIADIDVEKGYRGDGQNYVKVLLGKSEAKRKTDLMWDFGRNEAFNKPSDPYDRSPHLAIRSGKWKLLVNGDGSDVRLYDMERDKYEKNDIASEYPDVAGKLSKKVCRWFAEYRAER